MMTSCTSDFRDLRKTEGPQCTVSRFRPAIDYALYATSVDILSNHLSGLLVFKTMPDSSLRAVFQSEMGVTYFDFEWKSNGSFQAQNVLEKMDKKVIINTLRKDFELMLMNTLDTTQALVFTDGLSLYTRFPDDKEYIYAVTDTTCSTLDRMERASRRKAKVDVYLFSPEGIPDSVLIEHRQFKFTISLTRIPQ